MYECYCPQLGMLQDDEINNWGYGMGLLVTENMPSKGTTLYLTPSSVFYSGGKGFLQRLWCCCQDEWPHHGTKELRTKDHLV